MDDEILDVLELIPPRDSTCPECAANHKPGQPHDRNSLYYQMTFYRKNGRIPTWQDAMEHCDEATKAQWYKDHGITPD